MACECRQRHDGHWASIPTQTDLAHLDAREAGQMTSLAGAPVMCGPFSARCRGPVRYRYCRRCRRSTGATSKQTGRLAQGSAEEGKAVLASLVESFASVLQTLLRE